MKLPIWLKPASGQPQTSKFKTTVQLLTDNLGIKTAFIRQPIIKFYIFTAESFRFTMKAVILTVIYKTNHEKNLPINPAVAGH